MIFTLLKYRRVFIFLLVMIGTVNSLYSQTDSISIAGPQNETIIKGRILDEGSSESLPGTDISIQGTAISTVVDSTGYFELRTLQPPPITIIINSVGYKPREYVFNGGTELIEVKLTAVAANDAVVIVGYGKQKKKDVTGAISSVPTELKAQPVASLERLLQGTVAGAAVTQTSGQPGGGVSVQIRGNNSITAGSDPLYVIDGFPINNEYGVNDAGVTDGPKINPLSFLNTFDIESIDVLKDASATAIYGSRGANGVVIITTKKGSKNQTSVTYDGYTGVQSVIREIPVMNAGEWWNLRKEAAANSGKSATLAATNAGYIAAANAAGYTLDTAGAGTDWQAAAFRKAPIQSHTWSVLSGTDKTRVGFSLNYFKQDGVLLNTDFKRYVGRVSIDHEASKRLRLNSNVIVSNTSANVAPAAIVGALLFTPPSLPIYKNDGSYVLNSPFETSYQNPINSLKNQTNETKTNRVLGSVAFDYKIINGLNAKVLFGADIVDNKQNRYLPISTFEGAKESGIATVGSSFTTNWLNENTLDYTKRINKNNTINALAGFTLQQSNTKGVIASQSGFANDLAGYNNLGSGTTTRSATSFSSKWAIASVLARVNYNLKDKYLLTFTYRADGSSRFADGNKWGHFPSIAAGWNVNRESFLEDVNQISSLKLRGSVGLTGNQSIPPYMSLSQISFYRYNFSNTTVAGYAPSTAANPNLGWEKTWQYDIGVDLGVFDNRINLVADYYYKRTSDLLLNAPVSGVSGLGNYDAATNISQASTVYQNIGVVKNEGVELAINSKNIDAKELKWNTTLVFARNNNRILSLGDGTTQIIPSISSPSVLQVGNSVGSFLVYQTDGVIQPGDAPLTPQANKNPGGQKYKDLNGDGKITQASDRVVINNQPDFTAGLTNTVNFKGFDLTVFLQASIGGKLYNQNQAQLELGTGYANASTDLLDHWSPTNTDTDVKAPYQDPAITISDRFIEDASYGRLKNLTLGYTVPSKWSNKIKVKTLRVYVSGQNLATWTKYKGFDPEVSFNGQSLQNKGIDNGVYPNSKTILGGLTITL